MQLDRINGNSNIHIYRNHGVLKSEIRYSVSEERGSLREDAEAYAVCKLFGSRYGAYLQQFSNSVTRGTASGPTDI